VSWRADGRQRSLTFENPPSAERFKTLLEDHGPDEALRLIELDEMQQRRQPLCRSSWPSR